MGRARERMRFTWAPVGGGKGVWEEADRVGWVRLTALAAKLVQTNPRVKSLRDVA
ncbi:hypothetical protein GCM10010425_00430 [Streptomyces spororaveus]|uniref:Uncharacterized protein n=1 Tax=Streptomyces spororaveus TaxID=284039 RepID=A0ABQ3TCG6_9ACTN|nr:hypothetical protein Sspor_36220 [Streptomyces spororaveus]